MKPTFINKLSAPFLAAGLTLSFSSVAAEGLYTADELMDADVYDSSGEEIGEVEDILLGNDMQVYGLVIKTGDILGMGGREIVAERGTFTVRTDGEADGDDFDDIDYEVHLDVTQEALKSFPEYDKTWWDGTRERLSQAWEEAKRGAKSAWESTKEASESAWDKAMESAEGMGEKIDREINEF